MDLQIAFDYSTAVKVAEYFENSGMDRAAEQMWRGLCVCTPNAIEARERLERRDAVDCGLLRVDRHAVVAVIEQGPEHPVRGAPWPRGD